MLKGIGEKEIGRKSLALRKCPNCQQEKLELVVTARYFHALFVPVFSVGKRVKSICQNCGDVKKYRKMPDFIKEPAEKFKSSKKVPAHHFIGLIVLVIAVPFIFSWAKQHDANELDRLLHPKQGDIYSYKKGPRQYTSYKVGQITKDSLYLHPNKLQVKKRLKLYRINGDENFMTPVKAFSRAEVLEMYEQKNLYGVYRSEEER